MDWFHKTMIGVTAATSLLVSGWVGYKIHERYNPQQVTFTENPASENLRK